MLNPIGFKVPLYNNKSIYVEEWNAKHFYKAVHFHEEYQLTYIVNGQGTLFVESNTYKFKQGETYLFGKNIIHRFKSEENTVHKNHNVRQISVFFKLDSFASLFNQNPETDSIRSLLENASSGLKLNSSQSSDFFQRIKRFAHMDDFDKVLELLHILNWISESNQKEYLIVEQVSRTDVDEKGICTINEIFDFTTSNYQKKISLSDVADRFNMTPTSFCRFFKLRTQKTFSQFLIELRVIKACELIRNGTHNTTESCFDSGFTNISNFHRHFKNITGMTPTQYKGSVVSN